MTLNTHQESLLDLLLQLASDDVPATVTRLAARSQRTEAEVTGDLAILDRRGLIDARRCRMTFVGLAVAVSRREASSARARITSARAA